MGFFAVARNALSSLFANGVQGQPSMDLRGALYVALADGFGNQATPSVVQDVGLAIVASGQTISGASAAAATAATGAGYLTLLNTETAGGKTIYIDKSPAAATSFPLPPGASVSFRVADVSTVFCFGTGGVLGWMLLR